MSVLNPNKVTKGGAIRWKDHPFHKQPEGAKELHKTCNACLVCLPITKFNSHRRAKFGVSSKCKKCSYQIQKTKLNGTPENLQARRIYARNYYNRPDRIEKHRSLSVEKHRNLRLRALSAYGNSCSCCGETTIEFLSIDHVDPKTKAHRGESGSKLYQKLSNLRYPEGFQCLCHNCNLAKGFYGECPHEKERRKCLGL